MTPKLPKFAKKRRSLFCNIAGKYLDIRKQVYNFNVIYEYTDLDINERIILKWIRKK